MTNRNLVAAARRTIWLFAVGAVALSTYPGAARADPDEAWDHCAEPMTRVEQAHGLPAHLLQAIAKVESGRWNRDRAAIFAWPWTVMAEGRGRFLPDKAAAIAEVRALLARGVRNIDVGCMQVNLHHHPRAFASLEEAFDPARNLTYAAGFLTRLRVEARSWTRAIGRYHSSTPVYGNRYRRKVLKAWREERHLANQRRYEALVVARAEREAARGGRHVRITSVAGGVRIARD